MAMTSASLEKMLNSCSGKTRLRTARNTKNIIQIAQPEYTAFLARSGFSAPMFWPTTALMEFWIAPVTTWLMLVILLPMPVTAEAIRP